MISRNDPRVQACLTPYRYPRPVLFGSGEAGAFDSMGVDIPFVFKHHGAYLMLYTGFDGIGYQSALAVSDDLIHWRHKGMVLTRQPDSSRWDATGGAATWLIKKSDDLRRVPELRKVDGRYWMVYHAYPGRGYEDGPAEIGLAWTTDEELLDWHRLDAPVFSWRDGADWEKGGLYKACVIWDGERWRMFYNAKNQPTGQWIEQTGVAVSDDLMHWTRWDGNPILRVTPGAWDASFVSDPCVVRDGGYWLNFYYGIGVACEDGGYHAQDGLAISDDLADWEKAEAPILAYGPEGAIDSGHAHKASVFWEDDVLYYFYCATRPWRPGDTTRLYDEFRTICVAADHDVFPE